ncbi:MAG: universal stress protein [Xanthomonadales bacterium]
MKGYRNILCATDFSTNCRVAAERAADLARFYDARLTLLHVIEHFPVDRSNDAIAPEDVDPAHYHAEKAHAGLTELADWLRHDNIHQEVHFSMQSAGYEIEQFVKEQNVDLVVIASHGRHGVHSILGSTAYKVAHNANCDVLTVNPATS